MDRLISEQQVLKVLDSLKANFTCYDFVTLDEVASHIKGILSAEPYKGMTNGEVIKTLFPQYTYMGVCVFDKNENIILHDINWNWWNSPYKPQEGANE